MTRTFASRAAPIALAALLTAAMLFATNALASHQYRVASAVRETTQTAALEVRHVTIAGHRSARA